MSESQPISPPLEVAAADGSLFLRQFTLSDAEDMFGLIDGSRDHLSQFDDETAKKYPNLEAARKSILSPKNPDRLRFGIRNAEGTIVGSINLTPDKDNPKKGEIGYYLGKGFTGKGYATKALLALTHFAFNQLGYDTIYGIVQEGNDDSVRVLERAGYIATNRNEKETVLTTTSLF